MAREVETSELTGLPLMRVRDVALRGWMRFLKRALDVAVSWTLLVLLSRWFLLMALLVKLTSPHGPVLHVQERVGLDGKPFYMLKFRSMRPDAEAESGPVWAVPNDPRRTRLGELIRRFSLDEFPQLINVLRGRDEPGRAAARAARVRGAVREPGAALPRAAHGEGGHDRLGAGQRPARPDVRSSSAPSTTCSMSRPGRWRSTSRSCSRRSRRSSATATRTERARAGTSLTRALFASTSADAARGARSRARRGSSSGWATRARVRRHAPQPRLSRASRRSRARHGAAGTIARPTCTAWSP